MKCGCLLWPDKLRDAVHGVNVTLDYTGKLFPRSQLYYQLIINSLWIYFRFRLQKAKKCSLLARVFVDFF
jgi:hypothetical protein